MQDTNSNPVIHRSRAATPTKPAAPIPTTAVLSAPEPDDVDEALLLALAPPAVALAVELLVMPLVLDVAVLEPDVLLACASAFTKFAQMRAAG